MAIVARFNLNFIDNTTSIKATFTNIFLHNLFKLFMLQEVTKYL